MLTNNTIKINDKTDNAETINSLLDQKPNRKILNIPLRLHIYNTARPNKDSLFEAWLDKKPKRRDRLKNKLSQKQVDKVKESSIGFNNWLKKTGETPVIVDEKKTKKSVKRLKDYHENNGWFDVKTSYKINKKENKRATIEYQVETGVPFILDSITTKIATPAIDSLYQKFKNNAFVKQDEQYKTTNFELERDRITRELRNAGVFHFNQDYINVEIDTIGTDKKVNVNFNILNRSIREQDSIRREPFKIYKVNRVNIITDNAYVNEGKPYKDSVSYKGYTLYSYAKLKYKPKALTDAVFINPYSVFRAKDRSLTYRYLSELRTFKYPNIEYIEHLDSSLTANIYLTPLKKFGLGFDAEISKSNIQTVGFSINPSLSIRNVFKGAETFEISAFTSIGASEGDSSQRSKFFDINELGIDLNLTIPRLFFPFNTEKIIPKHMSPSTRISMSASSQTNIGLDKQTLTGAFNYNWRPNSKVTNRLDLFNAQYVRNLNPGNYFDIYSNSFNTLNSIAKSQNYDTLSPDVIESINAFINDVITGNTPLVSIDDDYKTISAINERKNRLTENNLILSSSFSFTRDNRKNLVDEDFSIFRFKLESAGNLLANASKLFGVKQNDNDRYELFNVAYSQYIKTELDYVKHWDLGKSNVFAIRSFVGIAIPYGNSTNIPFSKSFFAGGANDNRAWSPYSLGPGSSETTNEFNEANLKIAFSMEHRFNIFGDLNGALFVDAGNIWNVLDDVENENATFTNFNSLKDIAIGSGLGLRYDFGFFVFRFDVGFKTYDPFYQNENRWFNDYNFSNATYNIGINYPF